MSYNNYFKTIGYRKCSECRRERNIELTGKLCHILTLGGFFIGVIDMLILRIVREHIGNDWMAFIIFCVCLGGICGFGLAKLYCYVTKRINERFCQEYFDIRILTDKIEELQVEKAIEETGEDFELVGEKDDQRNDS